jgi:hypothetical protein
MMIIADNNKDDTQHGSNKKDRLNITVNNSQKLIITIITKPITRVVATVSLQTMIH